MTVGTQLRLWPRRFVTAGRIAARGTKGLVTDLRLFANRWRGGPVFRHVSNHEFQMLVRADESVGREVYCFGVLEREESKFIRQEIKETDVCFDVGANVGYHTLLLAVTARRGFVHSFEPVPSNYRLLSANVALNGLCNVIVNQCAVGAVQEEADFVIARDGAFSSFVDTGRMPVHARVRVPVVTLDQYCQQRRIERVDFLKVDVEGAEEKVINGAKQLLGNKELRPRFIMLELNDSMLHKHGSSIDNVLTQMRFFGYSPFICHKAGRVPFVTEYYGKFENVFFALSDFQQ